MPSAGHVIAKGAAENLVRMLIAFMESEETIPIALKMRAMGVDVIKSIVIPSFPEFRLVINNAVVAFDFPGGKVPLEVFAVFRSVPKAPFDLSKKRKSFNGLPFINEFDLLDFAILVERNEES